MPDNQNLVAEAADPSAVNQTLSFPSGIFRAYDIRGVAGSELNVENIKVIAGAIATEALEAGIQTLYVGYDGRLSSPGLSKALISGILETGCSVIDLGLIPTPVLYFATHTGTATSGVMLTASHNPANYNGLKIVFNRDCLADNQIQQIRTRVESADLVTGTGDYSTLDISEHYIADICSRITLAKPLKLVVDCGNAVPAVIAPILFERLGCSVVPLYCELDGSFPNHHPDPTIAANLTTLASEVVRLKADLGIAFDGDGDRLGIVDSNGDIVSTDKLIMLLVNSIAPQYPGQPIVYDVKCSTALSDLIHELGAVPIMHRSGHSFMKQKMSETGAALGGEYAAHIFIKDRWFGFDDGLYAGARAIESLAKLGHSSADEFNSYSTPVSTPELKLPVADSDKFQLIRKIQEIADFPEARLILLDGLRVEFDFGWGLVRASNTSPALLLRFEANTTEQIALLKSRFKALIRSADKTIRLDF